MYKKFLVPGILFFVLAINLFLGLSRLENYSAVDEPYWTYGRTSKFWTAISDAEWNKTDVNDKPGITVAILSGAGLLKYDPLKFKNLRENPKTDQQLADITNINFYFRLPIFLFTLAMLALFYFFTKKLFGTTIALIAFILISFSPILFGISLIINPDSLLWIFMPFSLLTYFIFLKEQNRKYLILSGIFLGLSLLTKYVSNLLIIFYLLIPFIEYIFAQEKKPIHNQLKEALINYLTLLFFAMLTYYVLFPATWTNLEKLLEGTFLSKAFKTTWPLFAAFFILLSLDWLAFKSKITDWILEKITFLKKFIFVGIAGIFIVTSIFVMLDTYFNMQPFDFPAILASPKNSEANPLFAIKSVGNILADFYSLIFGISPLALFGFFFGIASIAISKKMFNSRANLTIFYFTLFIILYYLASTVNHVVSTVRYQIALYPLVMIIAAIGIYKFISLFKGNQTKYKVAAIILTALISFFGMISSKPNYFAYASSLLPQKYLVNYKDMGDGSFETAAYLNTLPNAKSISIWSDKGAVCAVFVGKCETSFLPKKLSNKKFDFVVVSSGRKSKGLKLSISRSTGSVINIRDAHETEDYDFKVEIAGRPVNYVKVISTSKLQQPN